MTVQVIQILIIHVIRENYKGFIQSLTEESLTEVQFICYFYCKGYSNKMDLEWIYWDPPKPTRFGCFLVSDFKNGQPTISTN